MKKCFYAAWILFCALSVGLMLPARAQRLVPDVTSICGGSSLHHTIYRSLPTRDGGFLLVGATSSNDGEFTPRVPDLNTDNDDSKFPTNAFAVRFNSVGQLQWAKTFGGSDRDYFTNAAELSNGDFALTGLTQSKDHDLAGKNIGDIDGWLVRLDSSGHLLWSRTYGSSTSDLGSAVTETPDGGLLLLCCTVGSDSDALYHYGGLTFDWLLVRTDASGNRLWRRMLVGSNTELGGTTGSRCDLYQAPDGGYYLAGYSSSHDSDLRADNPSPGGAKLLGATFLKLDSSGKRLWCKRYGSINSTGTAASLLDLRDTTLVAVGTTHSNDHHFTGNHTWEGPNPSSDMYLVKVDRNGDLIYSKLYGTIQNDFANGVAAAPDGGYMLLGWQLIDSPFQSGNHGSTNVAVYQVDRAGDLLCSVVYGGTYKPAGYEEAFGAVYTGKSWYVSGWTTSPYFTSGRSYYRTNGGLFVTKLDYWSPSVPEDTAVAAVSPLLVYPNPAGDHVRIIGDVQNSGWLQISNATGKLVWGPVYVSGAMEISTASWPAGIYRVSWQTADGRLQTQSLSIVHF